MKVPEVPSDTTSVELIAPCAGPLRSRTFIDPAITGWMTGNGPGPLRVTPAALTFEPNWRTRFGLRLSGPLVRVPLDGQRSSPTAYG